MVAAELIDDHVSANQCKLAVEALLKHETRRQEKLQESQLLPGKEQHVWLQVTVKQMHPEKKLKPHRIPLAHPIVDPRTSPVCLITKDPQREYKDLLEAHKIKFISRVVGVTKLKGKFKPFEARRLLLKENDLFLADERVVPLLPGLLGKIFFQAKKQPIPVCLTRKDLKGELERAISSTYFHQNQGTCSSIKIGTVSQPAAKVLANLKTALPAVAKAIKGGWDNIQSLHIKTSTSTSLPIWTCDLGADEGGRWSGLVEEAESGAEEESEAEDKEDEELEPVVEKKKAKGKKRAAEDEVEQPKKKAKPTKAEESKAATVSPASKKRKAANDEPSPAAPAASEEAPSKTPEAKRKDKGKGSLPESSASSSVPTASPTTRSVSAKKKARASATDFFEDVTPSGVAPPSNTPADGLKAIAPSGGKKRKGTEQTLVSGAISKLAEAESKTPLATSDAKPAKKVKAKAGAKSADQSVDVDTSAQKPANKTKGGKAADVPVVDAALLTAQDVKRKVAAASGLEKKKEKALKVKRSAKEALIGKKGL